MQMGKRFLMNFYKKVKQLKKYFVILLLRVFIDMKNDIRKFIRKTESIKLLRKETQYTTDFEDNRRCFFDVQHVCIL